MAVAKMCSPLAKTTSGPEVEDFVQTLGISVRHVSWTVAPDGTETREEEASAPEEEEEEKRAPKRRRMRRGEIGMSLDWKVTIPRGEAPGFGMMAPE